MQRGTKLGLLIPPAETEEKKNHLIDDAIKAAPSFCRAGQKDDLFSIVPFPKFSKEGFWRRLDNPKNVMILKSEILAADILAEKDRYCIKRLLVLAVNEKFYKVFLTRTTIHKNEFPFKCIVGEENEDFRQVIEELENSVIQDFFNLPIENLISSFLENLDGNRRTTVEEDRRTDVMDPAFSEKEYFKKLDAKKRSKRTNITEVSIEEIHDVTFFEASQEAEAFVEKQNEDFKRVLLEFRFEEASREKILQTFSIFIDLFGVDKLQAFFSFIEPLPTSYPLNIKYAISIYTLYYIATHMISSQGGRCYLFSAEGNSLPYIISEEGNIFILAHFPGQGLGLTYSGLHLNSATVKAIKLNPINFKLKNQFSIILPVLLEQPPYFIPPPSYNHCMDRDTGCLNEILINDLLAGDAYLAQFKPIRVLHIMTQGVQGLSYLHARGLMHGDVHPGNFLLKNNDDVCINDFDFTVRIGDRIIGHNPAFAPQVEEFSEEDDSIDYTDIPLYSTKADPRIDSFCLGVSIYKLLIGKNYCDDNPINTPKLEKVLYGDREPNDPRKLFSELSQKETDQQIDKAMDAIPNLYKEEKDRLIAEGLLRLCKLLVVSDPNKRLSCTEILPSFLSLQASVTPNQGMALSPRSNMTLRFFPVAESKGSDVCIEDNLEHFQELPSRLQPAMVDDGVVALQQATAQINLTRLNL